MYHDEFAAVRSGRRDFGSGVEARLTGLALQAGGGVSLAMAASLYARPLLPAIYDLAALIPLAAASASILARRCSEAILHRARLLPAPAIPAPPSIYRGPARRPARARSGRVHPGRMG